MGWREKFHHPHLGDCGVARFKQVEDSPRIPPLSIPPWEKSSCVFSKAKTEASQCQFLFHIKAQSFGARRWLLSRLSPHAGSLALFPSVLLCPGSLLEPAGGVHMAASCTAPGATWLRRKNVQAHRVSTSHQERVKEHLCSPGIILSWAWDGAGDFSK